MAKYTAQARLKELLERQLGSEVKGLKYQASKLDCMLEAAKVLSREFPGPTQCLLGDGSGRYSMPDTFCFRGFCAQANQACFSHLSSLSLSWSH